MWRQYCDRKCANLKPLSHFWTRKQKRFFSEHRQCMHRRHAKRCVIEEVDHGQYGVDMDWPTFTQTNLFCSHWWRTADSHHRGLGSADVLRTATVAAFGASAGGMDTLWLVGGAADGTGSVHSRSLFQSTFKDETDFLNFQKVILHVRYLRYVRCWPFLLTRWNAVKLGETCGPFPPCFAETALEDELGQNADGPLLCLVKRTGRPLMVREMLVAS